MELLKQELYKIFSKKHLFLILALMLLFTYGFDLITVVTNVKNKHGSTNNTYNYTKPFEGKMTKEKEDKIARLLKAIRIKIRILKLQIYMRGCGIVILSKKDQDL